MLLLPRARTAAHTAARTALRCVLVAGAVSLALAPTAAATAATTSAVAPAAPAPAARNPLAAPSPGAAAPSGDTQALQEQVAAQEAAVEAARARLLDLAAQAGAALEAYQNAVREQEAAVRAHQQQTRLRSEAQDALEAQRATVARWTSEAYRRGSGSSLEQLMAVIDSDTPDDLERRTSVLRQVGRAEARTLATADAAASELAMQVAATEETARRSLDTAEAAEAAKIAGDQLVADQAQQVTALEGLLAGTRTAADEAARTEAATAARASAASSGTSASAVARALAGWRSAGGGRPGQLSAGTCPAADLSGFANGQIPVSALCALPGSPGHALRSDAAAAFASLSEAYRAANGASLCITDSYRDLASQVSVFARKPGLAAKPGTSNHGWGVAVDLCGGVQTFGSPQHAWMQLNAPLYGWFHPRWAQQGGSKPEAWHWEYAG